MRATEVGTASTGRARQALTTTVLIVVIGAVVVFVPPASDAAPVGSDDRVVESAVSVSPGSRDVPGSSVDSTRRRPSTRPVVVLYGDSLAWEARDHFVAAFASHADVDVVVRTFGGTAICDWLGLMRTDAAELAPSAVVVEFSGNALTDCMLDRDGRPLAGAAYLDRYRADAEAVVEIFRSVGAHLYLVGAPSPGAGDGSHRSGGGRLDALHREVAEASSAGAEFVDAGAAVLDEDRWTRTLPCLPAEPCEGGIDPSGAPVNVVRAPDGNHFCPVGEDALAGVTGECPVWSSGAFRFAHAMAQPVIDAIDG